MVALYCTYLVTSAAGNHTHATCNPLTKYAGAGKGTVVLGGLFTFVAIAHSMTRAATQGRALVGKNRKGGVVLAGDDDLGATTAIPVNALNEMEDDGEDDTAIGEEQDDERTGTRSNVRRSSPVWLSYLN